ncbi:MAG TPA: hypothetical protein VGT41_00605 [Candidatus Babeliales bacterium]|nr:hypothetical protein [Candidatus Babeliales bacterium]
MKYTPLIVMLIILLNGSLKQIHAADGEPIINTDGSSSDDESTNPLDRETQNLLIYKMALYYQMPDFSQNSTWMWKYTNENKDTCISMICNTMYKVTLDAVDPDTCHNNTIEQHFFTPSYEEWAKEIFESYWRSGWNPVIGSLIVLIAVATEEKKIVPPTLTLLATIQGYLGVIVYLWKLNKTRSLIAERRKQLRAQKKPRDPLELDTRTAILSEYRTVITKVTEAIQTKIDDSGWSEKKPEQKKKYLRSTCKFVYNQTIKTYQEAFPMAIFDNTTLEDLVSSSSTKTTPTASYTSWAKDTCLSRWNPLIGIVAAATAIEVKKRKLAPPAVITAMQLGAFGQFAISTGVHIKRLAEKKNQPARLR